MTSNSNKLFRKKEHISKIMKGRKNKQNKLNIKNRKSDEKTMEDGEVETNASTSMTDEQFLLEIEEYAKKLDEKEVENEDTTNFDEDGHELEIDHLHQIIEDLKVELNTEKKKVENIM